MTWASASLLMAGLGSGLADHVSPEEISVPPSAQGSGLRFSPTRAAGVVAPPPPLARRSHASLARACTESAAQARVPANEGLGRTQGGLRIEQPEPALASTPTCLADDPCPPLSPEVAALLDPDSVALVQALLRIALDPHADRDEVIESTLFELFHYMSEPDKERVILTLAAYRPELELRKRILPDNPSKEFVAFSRLAYLRSPSDENLEVLKQLAQGGRFSLDSDVLEQLLRSHPDEIDSLLDQLKAVDSGLLKHLIRVYPKGTIDLLIRHGLFPTLDRASIDRLARAWPEGIVKVLAHQNSDALDGELIERLLRSDPKSTTLQEMLVSAAPGRAAEVFAQGGLSLSERRSLLGVVPDDDSQAAAQALLILEESLHHWDLITAFEFDATVTQAFLDQRRGDPTWRDLELLARLELIYEQPQFAQVAFFTANWRKLSLGNLVLALRILDSEPFWSPAQSEALARIVAGGTSDQVRSALDSAPRRERWPVLSQKNWTANPSFGEPAFEAERYGVHLQEDPFAARKLLGRFFQVCPLLEQEGALILARSFQAKGDAKAAMEVLEHAPRTPFFQTAREHLAGGFSLEDLEPGVEEDDDE